MPSKYIVLPKPPQHFLLVNKNLKMQENKIPMSENLATIIEKSGILRQGKGNSWECLIGTGNIYGAQLVKQTSPLPFLLTVVRIACINLVRSLRILKASILMRPSSPFVVECAVIIRSNRFISLSKVESVHFSQANGTMVVIKADIVAKIYFRALEERKLILSIQNAASGHSIFIPPVVSFEENGLLLVTFPRYKSVAVEKLESPVKLVQTISDLSDVLSKIEPSLAESLTIYNQILGWLENNRRGIDDEIKEKAIEVCMKYTSSLDRAKIFYSHLQHGDLWSENIIYTPEPIIIDFDNLLLSPKHYDFVYFVLSEILHSGCFPLSVLLATKPPAHNKAVVVEECRRIVQIQEITLVEWMACENLFLLLKFCFCFTHNSIFSGQEVVLLEELNERFDRFPNEPSWVSSALGL